MLAHIGIIYDAAVAVASVPVMADVAAVAHAKASSSSVRERISES
jgi:hypothetical protein